MAKKTEDPAKFEQEFLPGTAPKKNERVHKAALGYAKERNKRMNQTEEEKAAHDRLLGIMGEEGLTDYEYGDVVVHVDATKKCKVKIASDKE